MKQYLLEKSRLIKSPKSERQLFSSRCTVLINNIGAQYNSAIVVFFSLCNLVETGELFQKPYSAKDCSMGTSKRQSLDELIADVSATLTAGLNTEIEPIMAPLEYGKVQIIAQQKNETKLRDLIQKRNKELGESVNATKAALEIEETFRDRYEDTIGYARSTFKQNFLARETMHLDDRRKRTINGSIEQAQQFYDALLANNEWVVALKRFGKTEDILREEYMMLAEFRSAQQIKQKESAEAETATANRDQVLDNLLDWVAEYKGIAKIALKKRPDLLRLLNI